MLVVDDDADHAESLKELLEADGYVVSTASGGRSAMAYLASERFDVVLLDLMMPDVGGEDVLDYVCANGMDTAVVVVSGANSVEGAVRALGMGACEYLRKPCGARELLSAVECAASTAGSGSRGGVGPRRRLLSGLRWESVGETFGLSRRELQILRYVFEDQKEYAIALELGISQHTVHTYLGRLYRKLGVTSRVQLVLSVLDGFLLTEAARKVMDDQPARDAVGASR